MYDIRCAITFYAIEAASTSLRSDQGRKNPQIPRDLDPAIPYYRTTPAPSAAEIGPLGRHERKILYLLWKCRKVQMLLWPFFAGRADGLW